MLITSFKAKSSISLTDKVKGLLAEKTLKVGFFESARYDTGIPVAQVAQFQEFGTRKIPPRPFMRGAIHENKDKWVDFLASQTKSFNDLDLALGRTGELVRNDIIKSIDNFTEPPNAIRTILAKKSSHPLINTGFMKSSVTYEIREKGK